MMQAMAAVIVASVLFSFPDAAAATEATTPVRQLVDQVLSGARGDRHRALAALLRRGKTDVVAALIQGLRFFRADPVLAATLEALTGARHGGDWQAWMRWQEAHPEITAFDGFDGFKADLLAGIDPAFRLFLRRGVRHTIRLQEIVWGGVAKDGIPALVDPAHIAAEAAGYLRGDELVFGIEIDGDARAYPLRILDWHEMFNDVIGGVPVALAYCTLCASGILYETQVPGRAAPLVFGSSGLLYRSNKLMYDRETNSLWNQFTGRPVVGPLTGSGIELKVRPVAIAAWKDWLARHPDTRVLSLDTGYDRDYTPGRPYGDYFASPELMFPARLADPTLKAKDYVFALRLGGDEKAWPLSAFAGGKVINDALGGRDVVLIGDAATRTVRAYDAGGRDFAAAADAALDRVVAAGETWRVGEEALVGADGERLARLPGYIAYWFAWRGFKAGAPLYRD